MAAQGLHDHGAWLYAVSDGGEVQWYREGLHGPGMDPYAIRRQPTSAARLGDFAWLVAGRGV